MTVFGNLYINSIINKKYTIYSNLYIISKIVICNPLLDRKPHLESKSISTRGL